MINEIPGPVWKDTCGHSKESYVGTFTSIIQTNNPPGIQSLTIDLYLFESKRGQSACLRFGDGPSDYFAPGPFINLFNTRAREEYADAVQMLQEKGEVKWTRKS